MKPVGTYEQHFEALCSDKKVTFNLPDEDEPEECRPRAEPLRSLDCRYPQSLFILFEEPEEVEDPGLLMSENPEGELPYIEAQIGSHRIKDAAFCLTDSGCRRSVMDLEFLQSLSSYSDLSIKGNSRVRIQGAHLDSVTQTVGTVDVWLKIPTEEGSHVSIKHTFLVMRALARNVILGQNFLSSPHIILQTSKYFKFSPVTTQFDPATQDERPWMTVKKHFNPPSVSSPILTICRVVLPPNGYTVAKVRTQFANDPNSPKSYPKSSIIALLANKEEFVDGIYTGNDYSSIPLLFRNPSHKSITIEPFTEVGQAVCSYLSMEELETPTDLWQAMPAQVFNLQFSEDCISDAVRSDFQRLELPRNEKELTDKQILEQVNTSHLNKTNADQLREMLASRMPVFARSALDVGNANVLEADIKLKDNYVKQHQKYVPIPLALKDTVQSMLEDLHNAKVIDFQDSPSKIISNLLCVKKPLTQVQQEEQGKSGSKVLAKQGIRLCLDLRLLNNAVKPTANPMADLTELTTQFRDAAMVSQLDLSQAYNSIKLTKEAAQLTSFYGPDRRRRMYLKLPYGFRGAAGILDSVLFIVLGDVLAFCHFFADDLSVLTRAEEGEAIDSIFGRHLKHLEAVLYRLEKAGLKIKASKTMLARQELQFLGLQWQAGNTLTIPHNKLHAFRNLPRPTTAKMIKQQVMSLSFYRRWCPHFSHIVRPLLEAAQSPQKFKWGQEQEEAWHAVKKAMENSMELYIPDPNKPYVGYSDASDYAMAYVLTQKSEGRERLVAAVSKSFSKAERNYSTYKKELLALTFGLHSLKMYVTGARIVQYTDARAALYLRACRHSSSFLMRMSLKLSQFQMEIRHLPGSMNGMADMFSRHIKTPDKDIPEIPPLTEKESIALVNRLAIDKHFSLTPEQVRNLLGGESMASAFKKPAKKGITKPKTQVPIVKHDQHTPQLVASRPLRLPKTTDRHPFYREPYVECKHIDMSDDNFPCLECNMVYPEVEPSTISKEAKELADFESLTLGHTFSNKGVINREEFIQAQSRDTHCMEVMDKLTADASQVPGYSSINGILLHKRKPVLPVSLLYYSLYSIHFSAYSHHMSKHAMFQHISQRFFFPFLKDVIADFCSHCYFCSTENAVRRKRQKLGKNAEPARSREVWSLDLFSGFGTTPSGHRHVVIFVDNFSLFSLALPLVDKSTGSIITALKEHILMHFGPPKTLRTDGETAILRSEIFQRFLKTYGIDHAPTAPSSPWSNGLAERMVAKYKEAIRSYAKSHQDTDISEFLSIISNSFNQTPTTYGPTPSELMYGFTNTRMHDILPAVRPVKNHKEYLELIQDNIRKANEIITSRRNRNKQASTDSRNSSRAAREFQVGQVVNLRNTVISRDSALVAKQKGPFVVENINANNLTCNIKDLKTGKVRKAHFDHLVAVTATNQISNLNPEGVDLSS